MARVKAKLSAEQIEVVREKALSAIAPLRPADRSQRQFIGSERTQAGQALPEHYLVYFLLVDLLKFPHGGREEKVAWTVPVEFEGRIAFIEHRKMGIGVFSKATADDEKAAASIVKSVGKGVKAAIPFFDHLAAAAVEQSRLNVRNNCAWLFSRYEFLREQFHEKAAAARARKEDVEKHEETLASGITHTSYSFPSWELSREASWLGIAAIEAFFSWTEHVLIQLAILQGKLRTGEDVANLAAAEWSEKVKMAIELDDPAVKSLYGELLVIRRQIRNYMAHGAFGKHGEAFDFHSTAGAVPVNLTDAEGRDKFSIWFGPSFDESGAIDTAEGFIAKLWDGDLAPAKLYLQEASMPVILTYASDGTYENAMSCTEAMEEFIDGLAHQMDEAANMDW